MSNLTVTPFPHDGPNKGLPSYTLDGAYVLKAQADAMSEDDLIRMGHAYASHPSAYGRDNLYMAILGQRFANEISVFLADMASDREDP